MCVCMIGRIYTHTHTHTYMYASMKGLDYVHEFNATFTYLNFQARHPRAIPARKLMEMLQTCNPSRSNLSSHTQTVVEETYNHSVRHVLRRAINLSAQDQSIDEDGEVEESIEEKTHSVKPKPSVVVVFGTR